MPITKVVPSTNAMRANIRYMRGAKKSERCSKWRSSPPQSPHLQITGANVEEGATENLRTVGAQAQQVRTDPVPQMQDVKAGKAGPPLDDGYLIFEGDNASRL